MKRPDSNASSGSGVLDRPLWEIWIVAALVIALLLPFSGKAFHIDDTLFVWVAKQVTLTHLDFFGFTGNWGGIEEDARRFIKNPPLTSYYMALFGSVFGWSERVMHIALIFPAVMAGVGMLLIARRLTTSALIATLAGVMTPAFAVSGTTVMSDVTMLALWAWAIFSWMKGMDEDRWPLLVLSGVLIAGASLAKYFAMSLIPLLAVYTTLGSKKKIRHLAWLIIPTAILVIYQVYTEGLYGRGLLLDASAYSVTVRSAGDAEGTSASVIWKLLLGLTFTGGGGITLLFMQISHRPLKALAFIAGGAIVTAVAALSGSAQAQALYTDGSFDTGLAAQFALFLSTGSLVLWLTIEDLAKKRSQSSLLLCLWVFGTFAFAVFFNWTISIRTVLPIAVVSGIIFTRSIEDDHRRQMTQSRLIPAIMIGIIASLSVSVADYSLANAAKKAASIVLDRYSQEGRTLWFQGHWGFQYYMEEGGAKPIDFKRSYIAPGEIIATPLNATNRRALPAGSTEYLEEVRIPTLSWASTMGLDSGAGFYASAWGSVPYRFGRTNDEVFVINSARYVDNGM